MCCWLPMSIVPNPEVPLLNKCTHIHLSPVTTPKIHSVSQKMQSWRQSAKRRSFDLKRILLFFRLCSCCSLAHLFCLFPLCSKSATLRVQFFSSTWNHACIQQSDRVSPSQWETKQDGKARWDLFPSSSRVKLQVIRAVRLRRCDSRF